MHKSYRDEMLAPNGFCLVEIPGSQEHIVTAGDTCCCEDFRRDSRETF